MLLTGKRRAFTYSVPGGRGGGWVLACEATARLLPGRVLLQWLRRGDPASTLGPRLQTRKERGLSLNCERPDPVPSSVPPARRARGGQTRASASPLPLLPTGPAGP